MAAVKTGFHTVVDKMAKVAAGIEKLAATRVMVGVPADKTGRGTGPINNAALLYIHENGAPEVNIPARPTLVPGIESVKTQIDAGLKKAGEFALDGRGDAVERQYHRVGAIGRVAVKNKITSNVPPPLAESTLAKRRARGATSTNTLIDKGGMRNAIEYVVRKTGEENQ